MSQDQAGAGWEPPRELEGKRYWGVAELVWEEGLMRAILEEAMVQLRPEGCIILEQRGGMF